MAAQARGCARGLDRLHGAASPQPTRLVGAVLAPPSFHSGHKLRGQGKPQDCPNYREAVVLYAALPPRCAERLRLSGPTGPFPPSAPPAPMNRGRRRGGGWLVFSHHGKAEPFRTAGRQSRRLLLGDRSVIWTGLGQAQPLRDVQIACRENKELRLCSTEIAENRPKQKLRVNNLRNRSFTQRGQRSLSPLSLCLCGESFARGVKRISPWLCPHAWFPHFPLDKLIDSY